MKKRKKIDDNGFSIVEAMVAIVILSIIFIPVTNSFISSIKASKETKIMQEATSTAQLVMEDFKKKTFEDLASEYFTTDDLSNDTWTSIHLEKDFLAADNKCCDFNVKVDVSKTSTVADTSGLNGINAKPLEKIYSLESASSYQLNIGSVPDWVISDFASQSGRSESYVKARTTRTIKIKLEEDAITGNTHISGEVNCIFGANTKQSESFDVTLSSALKNLYLFYVADYNGEKDTITVDNDAMLDANFYIMGKGADPTVAHFYMEESGSSNLHLLHVITTVSVNTSAGATLYGVSDEAAYTSKEASTRRYEIKVEVQRKRDGKVYSSMISTRGE